MSKMEWVDAPPKKASSGPKPAYGEEAYEVMKSNPGKWAKLHTYSTNQAAIQAAKRLRRMGYEAESRLAVLYARWPENGKKNGKGSDN